MLSKVALPLNRRRRSVVGIACGGAGVSIPTIKGLEAQSGDLGGGDYRRQDHQRA
jgi:hypothetical protein